MEYINITEGYSNKEIEKVTAVLKSGGVIIIPTDTVYGIAADAINEAAVKKIYEIKHRDFTKPCNILASDIEMIKKVTKGVSEKEEKIIRKFFPGPLTIIFEKNEQIPEIVTSNLDTVGIRIPDCKFLLDLIEYLGRPIVATSLNLAGEKSMTNVDDIPLSLKNGVDIIVDGGEAKVGTASTIIKEKKGKIEVLREGPITRKDIEQI